MIEGIIIITSNLPCSGLQICIILNFICYRLSGSLFFDEKLAVTNNKLTFQNLSSVKQTISDNASRSKIIFEVSRGGKVRILSLLVVQIHVFRLCA